MQGKVEVIQMNKSTFYQKIFSQNIDFSVLNCFHEAVRQATLLLQLGLSSRMFTSFLYDKISGESRIMQYVVQDAPTHQRRAATPEIVFYLSLFLNLSSVLSQTSNEQKINKPRFLNILKKPKVSILFFIGSFQSCFKNQNSFFSIFKRMVSGKTSSEKCSK